MELLSIACSESSESITPNNRLPTPPVPVGPEAVAAPPPGPSRGRLALVLAPMVLGAVLFALGHPAGAVLGLLGGSALIGVEVISRLGGGGGTAA